VIVGLVSNLTAVVIGRVITTNMMVLDCAYIFLPRLVDDDL
jgi:hypothetical protein